MSGIINLVAKVDSGKYKTIKQVADIVSRDPSTIRHAIRDRRIKDAAGDDYEGATHKMPLGDGSGKSFVWLYTDEDIEILKAHFVRITVHSPKRKKKVA